MNAFKRIWQPVYQSHRGVSILICKIVVVAMMACLGSSFAQLAYRISLESGGRFYPGYLPYLAVLFSIEAMLTRRRAADLDGREKWIFRASEVLSLMIGLKLLILLRAGIPAMLAEISAWQANFAAAFFSVEYFAALFLLGFAWGLSALLASDIDDLHDREQDAVWDELGKVQNALHLIRSRIMNYVFITGGLVLFFSVGSRLNFRAFVPFLQGRFDPAFPIANVLVFFVLTLILLSQTQFALLRTRWLWNKTPVAPRLGRAWLLYGLVFFSALGLLSFLLPTGYFLNLFVVLRYLLNILSMVFQFILFLVTLPFTLCASLFRVEQTTQQVEIPTAAALPPPPAADGAAPSWWQIFQSILFWGTLLAVVFFALSQYLKTNAFFLKRFASLPFFKWLSAAARAVWGWLSGANRAVTTLIAAGLRRLRPTPAAVRRLERLLRTPGGHTPREQVIEIFLTLVELGRRYGPFRASGETPYQYSQEIITAHPDISTEVLDLTEAFNEARYSEHPIKSDALPALRAKWERIRKNYNQDQDRSD